MAKDLYLSYVWQKIKNKCLDTRENPAEQQYCMLQDHMFKVLLFDFLTYRFLQGGDEEKTKGDQFYHSVNIIDATWSVSPPRSVSLLLPFEHFHLTSKEAKQHWVETTEWG